MTAPSSYDQLQKLTRIESRIGTGAPPNRPSNRCGSTTSNWLLSTIRNLAAKRARRPQPDRNAPEVHQRRSHGLSALSPLSPGPVKSP